MSNIFPVMVAPRWPRVFMPAAIVPSLALLATAGAVPLNNQNAGALPPPRSYPVSLRTWCGQVNQGLIGKDVFFGPPGMGPPPEYDLNPTARTRLQQTWTQNLLETTLAPGLGAPFAQNDWPLPRGAFYSPTLRSWVPGVPINLLGKDTFFGGAGQPLANADWPTPRSAPRLQQTWISPSPGLLGKDTFFGGPGQPPANADWPLPRAATRLLQSWEFSYITAPIVVPFAQTDWPLPRSAPRLQQTWISPAPGLLGQDVFFGAAGQPPADADWRIPSAQYRLPQTWSLNLLQSALAPAAAPFAQTDWPLPRAAAWFDRSWSQTLLETTLAQVPLPFLQQDWKVPAAPPRIDRGWSTSLTAFLTPPAQAFYRGEVIPLPYDDWRITVRFNDYRFTLLPRKPS